MSSRALPLLFLLAGCGRYATFRLPEPAGEGPSAPYRWEALPEPVLRRGLTGEWDSVDALNPSVVRREGMYYNFYSGFDGLTWRTGLATSEDGLTWRKHGPVISPQGASWEGGYIAANGAALLVDGEFWCWYQAGRIPRIGFARSGDGRTWRKEPSPVLSLGPRGSWDERGVADPFVLRVAGVFYMYYLGEDRARRQRLGVARSQDGRNWEKLRSNPILELGPPGAFDEVGLGEPAVWAAQGRYWMLYTGRDRSECRRMGLARSPDGVRWEKWGEPGPISGNQPWNARVVCDATVEVAPGEVRVWFGGGDVPHPAERINGQIGFARLLPVSGTLSK